MLSLVCIPTVASCTCTTTLFYSWIWCEKNGSLYSDSSSPCFIYRSMQRHLHWKWWCSLSGLKSKVVKKKVKSFLINSQRAHLSTREITDFFASRTLFILYRKVFRYRREKKLSHRSFSLPSLSPLSLTCLLSQFGYRYRRSPLSYVGKIGEKKSCWKVGKYLLGLLSPFLLRSLDYSFSVSLSRLGCLFFCFLQYQSRDYVILCLMEQRSVSNPRICTMKHFGVGSGFTSCSYFYLPFLAKVQLERCDENQLYDLKDAMTEFLLTLLPLRPCQSFELTTKLRNLCFAL